MAKKEYKVGIVNAAVSPELKKRYNIQAYPTLIWFVKGNPFPYDGGL